MSLAQRCALGRASNLVVRRPGAVRQRRCSAAAARAYRREQQQEGLVERPPPELTAAVDLRNAAAAASAEELQRSVRQLQADNAELQDEIRHLATSLKAALEMGASAASIDLVPTPLPTPRAQQQQQQARCAGGDCSGHDEQQRHEQRTRLEQQQRFDQQRQMSAEIAAMGGGPVHSHSHSHHSHANGGGGSGGGGDSWPGSDAGSLLASLDGGSPVAVPPYHQPTSVSQATLSCSVQHPGSICCSKLSSAMDPSGTACTISLHTTARCTADDATVHRHLAPEELRALAAHSLVGAAHAFSQAATAEYRAKSAPRQDVARAHVDLVRILESGVVICAERTMPSQFDHKSYLLMLQDPNTARRVRAIYKPRVYGDAGGWHRTPMEFVAYRLNMLLGLDLVPPTAYRTAPLTLSLGDEEDDLVFQEGAMMLWVEDCKLLKDFHTDQWNVDPTVLLSDTRILDVLLHNSDRHHGHFLLGPHWAQGHSWEGRWQGDMRPVLIDHAASFRKEAVVSMEHENAFGTGAVRCISAATYLRLRFLDSHTVAEELGAHLSRSEQRQLLHRRDYILHYFDELVASQGYAATVRE